jgi:hypothetical protein
VSDQTGMSFDTTWNEFLEYAVFGKPALATKSMRVLTVDKASIEESRSYTLKEGYTMTLVEVRAQACAPGGTRKIRVSTSGAYTGSSKVALWKADPAGSNRVFMDYLNAGRLQSDWIDLDDNKRVFALLSNNGAADIAASLTVQAQDCSTLPSFSRSYTGLNVYNRYTKADVSFELTGAYLSVREGFLPGMVGLFFKVPQPEPGKSMSFRLSAMPSNLVCLNPNPCPIDWKIDFASMGWGTTYANGSGAVTTLVIDQSKCWASSDFSYKVLKPPYFDVAFPLAVEVNGCP